MSKPIRIQRRRLRGWRKPANTICVDRTSRWGNPFKVGVHAPNNAVAVDKFKTWIISQDPEAEALLARAKRELRGKHLACYCNLSEVCHADVWLQLVNA